MKKYILYLLILGSSFLSASNEVIEKRQAKIKEFNAFANKNKKEKDIVKKFSSNPFLMYYMNNIYKKGKSERAEFFKNPFTEEELEGKRLMEEQKLMHEKRIKEEEGFQERKKWEESVDRPKISVQEKIKEFNNKQKSNYDEDYVTRYRKYLLEQAKLLKSQKEFIETNESLIQKQLKELDSKNQFEKNDPYEQEEKDRAKRANEKMNRLKKFNEEERMKGW